MSAARAVATATAHASARTTRAKRRAHSQSTRRPSCWIGLDGTPKGWSAAVLDEDGGITMFILPRLASLWRIQRHYTLRAIAIDMPLALPHYAEAGGRGCERVARRILSHAKVRADKAMRNGTSSAAQKSPEYAHLTKSKRDTPPTLVGHSSIFGPPTRAAMDAFKAGATHEECSKANRAAARPEATHSKAQNAKAAKPPAFGLSVQLYHIMPKIVEVEEFLRSPVGRDAFTFAPPATRTTAGQDGKIAFFECHPETAFLSMAACHDVEALHQTTTALYSKRSTPGLLQRLLLIQADESCASLNGGRGEVVLQGIAQTASSRHTLAGYMRALQHAKNSASAIEVLMQLSSWQSYIVDDNDNDREDELCNADRRQAVPTNDCVDAVACALAAHRFDNDRCIAIREGDEDELDHRGMPMTMFA